MLARWKRITPEEREVNQIPDELPSQLERTVADFVEYYNFHRYHKTLGNVTPANFLQPFHNPDHTLGIQLAVVKQFLPYPSCLVKRNIFKGNGQES